MRILHTADWHLGRNLEQNSRLEEQAAFLNELESICQTESVDLLLVAGDVFDTYNPPADAERLFYDALERLSGHGQRSVVVVAGNHDNPDRLGAAAPLAYRHGIILLGYPASDVSDLRCRYQNLHPHESSIPDTVLDAGPGFLKIHPVNADCAAVILTLPYPSEARLAKLSAQMGNEEDSQRDYSARIGSLLGELAAARFSGDAVNLVAAHFFVQGGWSSDSERVLQMGAAMLVDPADLPSGAQYIALGHLHRPQEVNGSPSPARYAGSPLAYSFSEAAYTKAVCLIDAVPGQPATIRNIPLKSGKPLRRWLAREGMTQALDWIRDGRDANCWIDLEITSDHLLTAAELKALRSGHAGIVYIRTILTGEAAALTAPSSRQGRRVDELFAEYYQFRNGVPIPDQVLATFLEMVNQEPEAGR